MHDAGLFNRALRFVLLNGMQARTDDEFTIVRTINGWVFNLSYLILSENDVT